MTPLQIATSGSVDDGKSTLIGRLLYETGSVPADRLAEVQARSKRNGLDFTDFSLLTDGLVAEREQGITIDVAHIYFSTPGRKYIIADTPGHEEYTRNMVTGASQSQAAIVLVDARHGVVRQTKRHLLISTLLDLPDLVIAVNKMDLVHYDPSVFERLVHEMQTLADSFNYSGRLHFIPVSALKGDNITEASINMTWYKGPTLLSILEEVKPNTTASDEVRFQVQQVLRPRRAGWEDYRGYAGELSGGEIRPGDTLFVASSGTPVRVQALEQWGNLLETGTPSKALTVHLEEDVDLPRGEWLLPTPVVSKREITAKLTWLATTAFNPAVRYLLRLGSTEVVCKVESVDAVLDVTSFEMQPGSHILANDIAEVQLRLARPLPVQSYRFGNTAGAFVLIEPSSGNTVAVGLVK